jgi:hypothetical protein
MVVEFVVIQEKNFHLPVVQAQAPILTVLRAYRRVHFERN